MTSPPETSRDAGYDAVGLCYALWLHPVRSSAPIVTRTDFDEDRVQYRLRTPVQQRVRPAEVLRRVRARTSEGCLRAQLACGLALVCSPQIQPQF